MTSTVVDDKPVPDPVTRLQHSAVFMPARGKTWISAKDLDPPKIENIEEKQASQKLLAHNSNDLISLSAICIGLLSLAMMLGVRLRRGLQPATILASSGELGPDMPMNRTLSLGDHVMEMKSQDSSFKYSGAALETKPPQKVMSGRVGSGRLSSQSARPLVLCDALAATSDASASNGR